MNTNVQVVGKPLLFALVRRNEESEIPIKRRTAVGTLDIYLQSLSLCSASAVERSFYHLMAKLGVSNTSARPCWYVLLDVE